MSRPTLQRVALGFPMSAHVDWSQGVARYAAQRSNWRLLTAPEGDPHWSQWINEWSADGVLVYLHSPSEAKQLIDFKIPAVNLSGIVEDLGIPTVVSDNQQIGHLAAEHLLKRCLKHFAFYGTPDFWYSNQRREGFCSTLRQAGCSSIQFFEPAYDPQTDWRQQQHDLETWIKTLPTPLGLLASHDPRGVMAMEACHRLGIRVPEDLAVIGVNNNRIICDFANPPLSSVPQDFFTVGYKAAELLDSIMNGPQPSNTRILLPVAPPVTRRSTDTLAIDDPDIAITARYVIDNVHQPFGVERLLRLTPVSRTTLQAGFNKWLGCTPYEFINRTRVERAKELLVKKQNMKLSAIMKECGFTNLQRFRLVFQRLESISPADYRKRCLQQLPAIDS